MEITTKRIRSLLDLSEESLSALKSKIEVEIPNIIHQPLSTRSENLQNKKIFQIFFTFVKKRWLNNQ